ncbi:TPA: HAD family hydrolase [Candidatus Woesearchaeota archaeon]|nr:HAD family hydrolase [Candidatus Woesearchaeota archaeon]HII68519.1 HAD family hydrolase [Candidatus Woesearchaeota archaeon]
MPRAIILDRDGTLNVDEKGYTYKLEDFRLYPDVIPALRRLQQKFLLIVISNQSGIAIGRYTQKQAKAFNSKLDRVMKENGVGIAGFYLCPHAPEEQCACRKPNTGLLMQAKLDFKLTLPKSYVIGDSFADVGLAKNAGCAAIYLERGSTIDEKKARERADYAAKDLTDAAQWILKGE